MTDTPVTYSQVVMGHAEPDFMVWYGTLDDLLSMFCEPRRWGNPEVFHG